MKEIAHPEPGPKRKSDGLDKPEPPGKRLVDPRDVPPGTDDPLAPPPGAFKPWLPEEEQRPETD